MFSDTQLYTFSNVHLKLYNKRNKRVLKELHKKNTITKLALNGIASMIKGEFNDTNYNVISNYVPKYLAMGTNNASESSDGVIGVSESVSVNDTCLLSEITKSDDRLIRIRLEDVKREDNSSNNDYIRIRFRTLVTSGTISYSTTIQELGLFIDDVNLTSGLFARIITEPITIPENSVLDVTWDVVIASSVGVLPTKVDILNANGEIITNNKRNPQEIASYGKYGNVYPLSVNLDSSIIDGIELVSSYFSITEVLDNGKYIWESTNNFNRNVRTVTAEPNGDKYSVTVKDKIAQDDTTYPSSSETYTKTEAESFAYIGTDASGSVIKGDGITANKLTYKDVTYRACKWLFGVQTQESHDNGDGKFIEIPYYDSESGIYVSGNPVIYNDGNTESVYVCLTACQIEPFDPTKWGKVFTIIRYPTDCIIINYNIYNDFNCCVGAETYNKVIAYTSIILSGTAEVPDIHIVPVGDGGSENEHSEIVDGVLGINEVYIEMNDDVLGIDSEITREDDNGMLSVLQ